MRKQSIHRSACRRSQAGTSLIEVSIALAILLIASVGIMGLAAISMVTTENQGHLMARASEYAQDKMEQLISLAFTDCQNGSPGPPTCANTATFPTTPTGGTGLAIGGSSNPAAPAAGYVDYLDFNGNPLPIGVSAPANWYYIRVWQVSTPAGAPVFNDLSLGNISTLKQITVTTKVRQGVAGPGGGGGLAPQATMTSLMTYPRP
jgi:hypothetical protein